VVNIGFVRAKANSEKNDFSPSRKCRLKSNEKYQNLVLPQQQDKKSTISIKFKNFLPTYVSQLKIGQNAFYPLFQDPILRLLNLQLQRQRCSRLERFQIGDHFNSKNALSYWLR
jgi:hypothetical protein